MKHDHPETHKKGAGGSTAVINHKDHRKASALLDELSFDRLLVESWEGYLSAKADGTPAQRSSALKAVYEYLVQSRKLKEQGEKGTRQVASDEELIQEIRKLVGLLAPTLKVTLQNDD